MEEELSIEEKWDRAGLSNNFIFYKVMRHNPDICKELLEILLEFEIDHIEMSQEESVFIDPNSKGIRMDVYLKNENQSFNLEMQATDTGDLSKRARYYQGVMDVDNLKSGELYSKLKDSYVIFICLNDIFGEGLPLYIFENFCQQNKNLKLDDRTYKYFFAACNCDKLLNERQRTFFDLLVSKKSSDSFTERLSQLITNAKHNTQWRKQFMDYEREIAYARAAGRTQGWEVGLAEGRELGRSIGLTEGRELGLSEGRAEGLSEGRELGLSEGRELGLSEGRAEGLTQGRELGLTEGRELGLSEGRELGLSEGRELGLTEGRAEGLSEGRELGLSEGRDEKALETAKQLIAMNLLSVEQISQATGLSVEKINELK